MKLDKTVQDQLAAIDADFLLHGGDLTRDGDTHEFEFRQALLIDSFGAR